MNARVVRRFVVLMIVLVVIVVMVIILGSLDSLFTFLLSQIVGG